MSEKMNAAAGRLINIHDVYGWLMFVVVYIRVYASVDLIH